MQQNVLIIDDSAAIHALLRARLKDEPILLHAASGGEQGLEMVAAILPDLILLDVEMPGLDGFEVCRRLKEHEKLHNIPVILMTGACSSEQKLRGLALGAFDYIAKPFDPAELRARVRSALRLKFMTDLLAQKAQLDAVTGLWNKKYLEQRFEAEISLSRRAHRPLAVLAIEVDGFKSLSEQFGHPLGDQILKRVAHLLAEKIRLEDVVCRSSGDEFVIIAPNGFTGMGELGERLRLAVTELRFVSAAQEVKVTISIGVAAASESAASSLVDDARSALAQAKKAGGNRVEIANAVVAVTASD